MQSCRHAAAGVLGNGIEDWCDRPQVGDDGPESSSGNTPGLCEGSQKVGPGGLPVDRVTGVMRLAPR